MAITVCFDEQLEALLELWPDEPVPLPAPTPPMAALSVSVADGTTECALPHDAAAPAAARQVTRKLLAGCGLPDTVIDSALIVTSELVTNAVEHALAPLMLHLHPKQAGRVWIGVTDGGPAPYDGPWTASCSADEHGRGRSIVDTLADSHGSHTHANGHTTHWARISAA
ncbi:ATP-binding protein [Streptomyces sp. NPDC088748]|uniref:ATP-binding protein n=1 Tax=Streptomyces sp. NPDC088748 TaxID=3365887 RepID=UPI00381C455D